MTKNQWIRLLMGTWIVLMTTGAAQSTVLYQEDFSYDTYTNATNASTVGWSYSATYGNNNWGIIRDEGTGTGLLLWAINGWTHPLDSTITGTNGTKIMVQALMWPQWGNVSAGLYSLDYSSFFYPGWTGGGPRMNYGDGKLTLIQPDAAGGASSAEAIVSGISPATACFTMVIDLMTGTADAYLGSVETGNLLIAGFNMKGTWPLAQFQANLVACNKFGAVANQGLIDKIKVSAVAAATGLPSFTQWQALYFTSAQVTNASISGPAASPLGDGLANKLKFALGRSPWEQFSPMLSAGALPDGRPSFILSRRLDAESLGLQLEASTDLTAWSFAPGVYETTVISNNAETETIRVSPPSGATSESWFLRFRIPLN